MPARRHNDTGHRRYGLERGYLLHRLSYAGFVVDPLNGNDRGPVTEHFR